MKATQVRNRFSRLRRTVILADPPKDSLTQQQFKAECDMNRIVQNAQRGIAPKYMARGVPHYGDFSDVPDLTRAYEVVARAEQAFMSLPAALRAELGNDPARIHELSRDQVDRYKLGKTLPEAPVSSSSPSGASSGAKAPKASKTPPKAGQAATAGTEPADD